jgi:hypothetical protein
LLLPFFTRTVPSSAVKHACCAVETPCPKAGAIPATTLQIFGHAIRGLHPFSVNCGKAIRMPSKQQRQTARISSATLR